VPSKISRRAMLAASGLTVGGLGAATLGLAPAAGAETVTARSHVADPAPATPREALERLLIGNSRFAAGRAEHPRQTLEDVHRLASGQHPFAVVLGCADSRVPAEIVFDQGLGDIFDDRVAGNIVDTLLLGSTEYAVEHLGPKVLLVLGHERCGAITATIEAIESGTEPPVHIAAIVDALRPIVEPVLDDPGDKVDNAVQANVKAQVKALTKRSEIIREKIESGALAAVGARYDLDTAAVSLVH